MYISWIWISTLFLLTCTYFKSEMSQLNIYNNVKGSDNWRLYLQLIIVNSSKQKKEYQTITWIYKNQVYRVIKGQIFPSLDVFVFSSDIFASDQKWPRKCQAYKLQIWPSTVAEKWNSGTIRWSEITSNSRCCLVKYYPHLCNVMTVKIPMMKFLGTVLSQNKNVYILYLSIIGVGYYLHLDLSFVLT